MKRFFFLILVLLSFSKIFSATEDIQGILYYNAGFSDVAKPLLIKELQSDNENKSLICFFLGNIYFQQNNIDSSAYYFNKGMASVPVSPLNSVGNIMIDIKNNPAKVEDDIKELFKVKGNKNNLDVVIALSRAFLSNGIADKALTYADEAKRIKPKSASVAVLLGDISLFNKDLGTACSNYETAIYYDDNCKEAYIKYARAYRNANPALSIEMLKKLQVKDPSFLLVDKELADLYYTQNDFENAAKNYSIYLQSGNSTTKDLVQYAMTLFLNKDFAKSLEVSTLGLQKDPRNPALNRLAMWNNIDLKNYEAGLKSADLFFNHSDNPDLSYLDFRYYGQALRETKNYDAAIIQFNKALKMDSTKIELWKDISDMFNDESKYAEAIPPYITYLNKLDDSKKDGDAIINLGKLYYSLATSTKNDSIKKDALIKADSAFAKVAALEPDGYRGNFWRARTNSLLDPDSNKGLAQPYYFKTATLVESKNDPRFNPVLIECYSYLGYYSLIQSDYPLSLSYWNKILAIEPDNSTALKAIAGIDKFLKAQKNPKK